MNLKRAALACLLLTTVFATQELLAQMGGGMGGMRGCGRPDSAKMEGQRTPNQESLADQVEYRLGLLQEDLKLRPEQYNVWAAYSDRIKALAVDMTRERSSGMVVTTGTALQQIDRVADVARNRLTAIEDIVASAKALYGTLSPEQKVCVGWAE